MTHNPTHAEVQAAYDETKYTINAANVAVLRAAVARDTLGWREVDGPEDITRPDTLCRFEGMRDGPKRLFVEDAAP